MSDYTLFDRLVAWLRFRAVLHYVGAHTRVCDLGCGLEGGFLHFARERIRFGVGVDYQVLNRRHQDLTLIRADLTKGLPLRSRQFDHIVLAAVLEHLPEPCSVLSEAFRILAPGGSLIITWPEAAVDPWLGILERVGAVSKKMESGYHQPRIPLHTLRAMLAEIGFERISHRRFELRLNNLLIAFKPRATAA